MGVPLGFFLAVLPKIDLRAYRGMGVPLGLCWSILPKRGRGYTKACVYLWCKRTLRGTLSVLFWVMDVVGAYWVPKLRSLRRAKSVVL